MTAAERAHRTMEAAEVLRAAAGNVARACANAQGSDLVVAVIDADLTFGGAWVIPRAELQTWVRRLTPGTWSLTFEAGDTIEDVIARSTEWEGLARRRWQILQRRAEE